MQSSLYNSAVGIANVNLSKIKTGEISAIRFSTLEAICDVLDCQPGEILEYKRDAKVMVIDESDASDA